MAAFAATLALLFGHPFVCYPTVAAFDTAAGELSTTQWAWGVAGLYTWSRDEIGLTPGACRAAARLGDGWPTLEGSIATFTIGHELGHAVVGHDETAADCYGAGETETVARALGVRGRLRIWMVLNFARRYAGYQPIPARCFVQREPLGHPQLVPR